MGIICWGFLGSSSAQSFFKMQLVHSRLESDCWSVPTGLSGFPGRLFLFILLDQVAATVRPQMPLQVATSKFIDGSRKDSTA